MIKTTLSATLALITTLASFAVTLEPARAGDDMTVSASVRSERVPYQVSELASEQGVRELTSQVRRAAHHVCEPSDDAFLGTYSEIACFSPTFRDGLAQIDRAVSRARSGLADAGWINVGSKGKGR